MGLSMASRRRSRPLGRGCREFVMWWKSRSQRQIWILESDSGNRTAEPGVWRGVSRVAEGSKLVVVEANTRILGIESSCDETAAAVVVDGREILSSIVASQLDVHRKYGGVVPELASREHLRQIVPVVREALGQARLKLQEVDAIGVTQGPGLVGALLVGITYGKTLAQSLGKPLVPVNHLEGHVHAVFL